MHRSPVRTALSLVLPFVVACAQRATTTPAPQQISAHEGHEMPPTALVAVAADTTVPAGAADVRSRLDQSPRHGEWVQFRTGPEAGDTLRAYVVYPQRSSKAPVVVVVHEIYGVSTWIRGVADRLAADGFIAIAPDMLTGKLPPNLPDSTLMRQGPALIRALDAGWVQRQIDATAAYAMALPAAAPRYGVVGYCWGGGVSFNHAVHSPTLGAAVVYYGTSPPSERLATVRAPVLGLYGENDARVNATIAPADSAMRALGKSYRSVIFPGAGHGFLRGQDQAAGANLAAARRAWPMTIEFFRQHLER